jgi:DNA-binding NtrC family response regulator
MASASLAPAVERPHGSRSMSPKTVLVVDDEEQIRSLIHAWLVQAGHGVQLAANAKEGLQLAGKTRFDLVVTDILMPDGDGLELIGALKTVLPSARVLAISGGGRYIEGDNCLKIARGWGAHAALIKPFDEKGFFAAMEQALITPTTPSLW